MEAGRGAGWGGGCGRLPPTDRHWRCCGAGPCSGPPRALPRGGRAACTRVPAWLTRVPAACHCGVEHVLRRGLALAVAQWCGRRGRGGSTAVLVDVEGHGREEVSADIDLSRTVGWFTSLYPVRLDVGGVDVEEALGGGAALGRALKLIKEQLRGVPGNGLGYRLLRSLNPRTGSQLAGFAAPQIGFNYLGPFAAPVGP